jgi:hypothetical protein
MNPNFMKLFEDIVNALERTTNNMYDRTYCEDELVDDNFDLIHTARALLRRMQDTNKYSWQEPYPEEEQSS